MKIAKRFLPVLGLIFLISCASNVTARKYTDDDFSKFKTFAYSPNPSFNLSEYDNNSGNSIEESLIAILNDKMIEKGFLVSKENPDLYVLLTTSDAINSNEDTKAAYEISSGSGSPVYSSLGSGSNNRFTGASDDKSNNKPYKKGSLIVEVFNSKSKKLLWVGSAKNFKSHISDQTLMRTMMNSVFSKFPK